MILVDYREQRSGVPEVLASIGCEYSVVKLLVGDYIIDNRVAVERKTSEDFVASLTSGRLFKQIAQLAKFPDRKLVLIEGKPLRLVPGATPDAVNGAILSILVSWEIPIVYTRTRNETARTLDRIRRQSSRIKSRRSPRRALGYSSSSPDGQKQRLLETLPSIGPALADRLLSEFGSLSELFAASEKDLLKVKGVGKARVTKIRDILREEGASYGEGSAIS